jgi:hypothetical protein
VKAKLVEFRVSPFDPMELRMMPPGQHYVEIHLNCDEEMARKLAEFFHSNGFEGAPPVPEAKKLEAAPKIIEAPKEPGGV